MGKSSLLKAEQRHHGWAATHARLAPEFAELMRRVEAARLRVGAAGPALSEEQFLALVRQQITMIGEVARSLVSQAGKVSQTANAHEPDAPATRAALEKACDEFLATPRATAAWAEALWSTTPPPAFSESFAALREIPGAIIAKLQPFLEMIAAAGEGRVATNQVIDIDIQPLIDRAARLGQVEARRGTGRSAVAGPLGAGCAWLVVALVVVTLVSCVGMEIAAHP